MGVTADGEIKIDDSLAAYESIVFANQLENDAHEGVVNNTTMKQLEFCLLYTSGYVAICKL